MRDLNLGFFDHSKVPLIRQTELAECGLACIAMIAGFHKYDIDLGSLRRRFAMSARGAPLSAVMRVADQIGMNTRAVKLPLENIGSLAVPAILHWDMNHFVVVEKVTANRALIHDPARGTRWYSQKDLSGHFTGVALEIQPSDNFERQNQRERLSLLQLWRRVFGIKRAMFQILVLSVVLQVHTLVSPYYMQVAMDNIIPSQDKDLLWVLTLGFGLFMLINLAASVLRSFVLLNAGTLMGFGISSNIVRRLFRLPVEWFERRHVGDVLSRFQSIGPIQSMLTTGAVAALLDGLMAIFTLALMFFYSPLLTIISLISFALYVVLRIATFQMQKDAQEATIVAGANVQSVMIESLRGMRTLRLFGKESERHAVWQTRSIDSVNAGVHAARIGIWQGVANSLIFGIEGFVTIWLAIGFVIEGGFSVGMIFAYLAYKGQFTGSMASLINQAIAFKMLNLHLERLSDIALYKEDIGFLSNAETTNDLKGKIELRDISFRYSESDPFVLQGVNLTVNPGEHIVITGLSGGGKSTLLKILMGLIEPSTGTVFVDDVEISRFGLRNFRSQIGAIMQDDALFSGSLIENVAIFEDSPDMKRVTASAQSAAIHDDIMKMPMQYETLVGDMGSTLSGGQKQRLMLARALYRAPRLLVIDEGTSHLDSEHEARVNAAINALGVTRIVVAHREETIRVAETAYELRSGELYRLT